jgi:MoxR-like ATPase
MSQTGERIGNKYVQLSQPYTPDESLITGFIGREETMEVITAAWMGGKGVLPLAPLLVGEPGIGKNRLVYELAKRTGKELYIFQGHEDVTAEDLACSVRFSDDPDKKMDYIASPLVTAMIKGGICFIDEIAKIRPRALALLVSVLDERRYIDSNLLGERVVADKGFRFIAATNTADLVGNTLPEFIRSRMRPVVKIDYQEPREIEEIIKKRFSESLKDVEQLLDCFWKKWNELNKDRFVTPRDAIYIFNLAISLADFEYVDNNKVRFTDANKYNPFLLEARSPLAVNTTHLEKAFNELYRDGEGEKR